METAPRSPALARITLVCLLIVLLGLLPYPLQLRDLNRTARDAAALQPATAAAATRQILSLQPWRVELWERAGRLELQAGHSETGISALEEARSRNALSMDGWLALGDAYTHNGDPQSAARIWQEQIWRFGPSAEAYARLLSAQRTAGDLDAALVTLTGWQALEPSNPRLAYQTGLFRLRGDPDGALPVLLKAARDDPALSAAVETLRKAVGLAGAGTDPAYGKVIIGRALGNLGEWDLARLLFRDAVALSPVYAEAWAFLGEANQNLGQDGLPDLQKAVQLDAQSITAQALLSVYWRRHGQTQPALDALAKIRQKEPAQIIWQIETGNTLAESGDLVAARPFFDRAITLEPGNVTPWLALAAFSVNYDVDISATGLPAARQALLLSPDNPAALDMMGMAFFKLGDLDSAERFLQRSLAGDGAQAGVSLHLGQVYLQQNRLDLALGPLSTTARLDEKGAYGALARRLLATYYPAQP